MCQSLHIEKFKARPVTIHQRSLVKIEMVRFIARKKKVSRRHFCHRRCSACRWRQHFTTLVNMHPRRTIFYCGWLLLTAVWRKRRLSLELSCWIHYDLYALYDSHGKTHGLRDHVPSCYIRLCIIPGIFSSIRKKLCLFLIYISHCRNYKCLTPCFYCNIIKYLKINQYSRNQLYRNNSTKL